jgi:hypothetical protein
LRRRSFVDGMLAPRAQPAPKAGSNQGVPDATYNDSQNFSRWS